jgi:hypothetical protein
MLSFPAITVSKVCIVDVTIVETEALFGEADRPNNKRR